MKPRLLFLLIIALLLVGIYHPAAGWTERASAQDISPADPFSPSARGALASQAPDQKAAFILTLSDQLANPAPGGLSPLQSLADAGQTKQARQQAVIESLQSHAASSQGALLAQARALQAVIVEQLKAVAETNKKVVKTIYGNGKPGLTTIVNETKKDVDAIMAVAKTMLFTVLGLGVTAVFYLVLSHGIIK